MKREKLERIGEEFEVALTDAFYTVMALVIGCLSGLGALMVIMLKGNPSTLEIIFVGFGMTGMVSIVSIRSFIGNMLFSEVLKEIELEVKEK